MVGGLIQLISHGKYDLVLTGNPQMTFFKQVFKRHSKFAIETIENPYSGKLDYGNTISVIIKPHADLLTSIVLELITSDMLPYEHNVFTIIDYIDFEIGGKTIDKQYGEWMFIWTQLNTRIDQFILTDAMIYADDATNANHYHYLAPLPLWFSKDFGSALPITAITNHEIKLNIKFKDLPSGQTVVLEELHVLCDYVFLSNDERLRIIHQSSDYIIEQIQLFDNYFIRQGTNTVSLKFKHPVKYLVFFVDLKENQYQPINTEYYYMNPDGQEYEDLLDSVVFLLNDEEIQYPRYGPYYRLYQQYKYFKGSTITNKWLGSLNSYGLERMYFYSFCLHPSEPEPSGSVNFSRISNFKIRFKTNDLSEYEESLKTFSCYAVNYNILRISSNMAGLLYN